MANFDDSARRQAEKAAARAAALVSFKAGQAAARAARPARIAATARAVAALPQHRGVGSGGGIPRGAAKSPKNGGVPLS